MDGEAVEEDAALVDLVEAGDAVEEGRLAGAVGPDDADDGALVQGEVQGVDGQQAAEALGGAADLEERHAQAASVGVQRQGRRRGLLHRASRDVPTRDGQRPSGRKRIMNMSTRP